MQANQVLVLSFILLIIRPAVGSPATRQHVQQIGQCSNEEYFNVNLLQCVRCDQTLEPAPERTYLSYISPVQFQQSFAAESSLGHQNFSFNAHSAATSPATSQLAIQSNLQRSPDGLSCVCKKGTFRFKNLRRSPLVNGLVNEMLCYPCPNQMVSSLNGNTCSFCRRIPRSYLLGGQPEQPQFSDDRRPKSPSSDECDQCGENEILVERLINSSELASLNWTALFANYNYSVQFNSTHLDQLLVQNCVSCPSKITRSINNQCKACHFSFEHCGCESENSRLTESNGVCIYANNPILENQELFKINATTESNGLEGEESEAPADESNKDSFISPYIQSSFPSSFSQCSYYHNITACQFLANACVLNHYRHRPSADPPNSMCDLYAKMNSKEMLSYLPQIYLTADILKRDSLESNKDFLFHIKSAPIEFGLNERLLFYAVAYNANGEFRGSRRLYLDELLICPSRDQSMDAIVRFAVNVEFKCRMQLSRLFESTPTDPSEQLFYELYLLPNQTAAQQNQSSLVYPIYVLNRNLVKNDQLVNQIGYTLQYFNYLMDHSNYFSELINRWQLVKRFFIGRFILTFFLTYSLKI